MSGVRMRPRSGEAGAVRGALHPQVQCEKNSGCVVVSYK